MVTIKDIAKYTGLSPSTVSIVLRGLSEKRNISDATKEKVLEAAKSLGYTPNMQSKLLRSNLPNLPVITLFWDSSTRQYILTRFLKGLQDSIINNDYKYDLQVKPYSIDHLEESMTARTLMGSNGIIICNASEKDMEYLENADLSVPVVLYNRSSSKYPTVNMNDEEIGSLAANVFVRHGKKRPVIISSKANFSGMNVREDAFCKAFGPQIGAEVQKVQVEDTPLGGYNGALEIIGRKPLPDCILCSSDNIAFGVLKAFHDKGIKIPKQTELISIGNGSRDHEEFSVPSLSVVSLPMEAMADACLARITRAITEMNLNPDSREFTAEYIARESCPY
ncbi:MAG: LacI family transcriptional regulator [Butyrivibrio sp.]|nr:LacI family transcriptional regulator [Butyrivibrio sp.]